MAGYLQLVEAVVDVVAVDVGDAQVVAVAGRQLAGGVGEPGGVQPPGVDDEADPVGHQVVERGVKVMQKRDRVALGGVLGAGLAEDEHGDLGEVVAREDVDAPAARHLGHGRGAVAVEAGAIPHTDGRRPWSGVDVIWSLPLLIAAPRRDVDAVLLTNAVPSNPTLAGGVLLDELEGHVVAVDGSRRGRCRSRRRRVDGASEAITDLGDLPLGAEALGDGAECERRPEVRVQRETGVALGASVATHR